MRCVSATLGVFVLVVLSCGEPGEPTPPTDEVPPELDEVVVVLGDPTPGTLDLGDDDVRRIIARPAPLTFRVFVSDDETAPEQLTVELIDPDTESPVEADEATFENGLWRVTTTARPGTAFTVRARDEAGNEAVWPHAAIFPSRAEALQRTWTRLKYDNGGAVVDRAEARWDDDGTWCADGDTPAGGSWTVDGEELMVEHRHSLGCAEEPSSGEWESVERTETGPFYVDETYFSRSPLVPDEPDAGLETTWRAGRLVDGSSQPVTLELSPDGTFLWSQSDGATLEGGWQTVENGGYEENFGDLLVLRVERVDGADQEPVTQVSFYSTRDGNLLVDPLVDTR